MSKILHYTIAYFIPFTFCDNLAYLTQNDAILLHQNLFSYTFAF